MHCVASSPVCFSCAGDKANHCVAQVYLLTADCLCILGMKKYTCFKTSMQVILDYICSI